MSRPLGERHPSERPLDTRPVAIVYCEGLFGKLDGKTANGLARTSERYRIGAVIDSTTAGLDAGSLLDGSPSGIPIVEDLSQAIAAVAHTVTDIAGPVPAPTFFIVGVAPLDGRLAPDHRRAVLEAAGQGLNIVSGLHEYLSDDAQIAEAAASSGATLTDIRRPRPSKDLRTFDGSIDEVDCIRIAILGTDGAIGKRTTATILTRALNDAGIPTVLISTGQTGLMQGGEFGIPLDAIPAQFGIGELEGVVLAAWEARHPRVMIIEGQGALSHPAYISSAVILRGARPQGVILQHAPARTALSDYPSIPMPTPAAEIALIELFGNTDVIGVTLNHEHLTRYGVKLAARDIVRECEVPVVDALWNSPAELVAMVTAAFPAVARSADQVVA